MRAYIIQTPGIENIVQKELPNPALVNDSDVLVEIKACSLNYRDLMVARGVYGKPSSQPFIPLSDMCGIVKEVGTRVTKFKPGDRVLNAPFKRWPAGKLTKGWASTFIGANGVDGVLAEYVVFPEDALVIVPSFLNNEEASTFTIAGLTAWSGLITHGKARAGDWVLLHGTGGVSIFAAQLAQAIGARTIMTTSDSAKGDFVKKSYGVLATVNYKEEDWPKKVRDVTQDVGVDVVLDVVGGVTLAQSIRACNYNARVSIIGVLSGTESAFTVPEVLRFQIQMNGIYMESAQELNAFMRAVEAIKLKPRVDKVFSFDQVHQAYDYLASQKHIGKVVVSID